MLNKLDENGYHIFVTQVIRCELQKGEALALQGDVWPYLLLVAHGEMDAVKMSSEGRNLVVTTFRAGELFWGPAFFSERSTAPGNAGSTFSINHIPVVASAH